MLQGRVEGAFEERPQDDHDPEAGRGVLRFVLLVFFVLLVVLLLRLLLVRLVQRLRLLRLVVLVLQQQQLRFVRRLVWCRTELQRLRPRSAGQTL